MQMSLRGDVKLGPELGAKAEGTCSRLRGQAGRTRRQGTSCWMERGLGRRECGKCVLTALGCSEGQAGEEGPRWASEKLEAGIPAAVRAAGPQDGARMDKVHPRRCQGAGSAGLGLLEHA